jgi:hypothetical protein
MDVDGCEWMLNGCFLEMLMVDVKEMLISIDSIITFPMKWWILMTFKKTRNTAVKHHQNSEHPTKKHPKAHGSKDGPSLSSIENSMSQ